MNGYSERIEIDASSEVNAVTFTTNSAYLVSGVRGGIEVRRVKDGEGITTLQVKDGVPSCVAVSKDARWIAAGSDDGDVLIWDTETYEQVFAHKMGKFIRDVDFSPDSMRLVSADSLNDTATIWDITARQKVQTLDHSWVLAAKYSPEGDRIATDTWGSVRVWDSSNGHLLADIEVELLPLRGLLWFNNRNLFVMSNDNKIKQIDGSTGLTVSDWSVPDSDDRSCIALPRHTKFIAYSTSNTITFWDTVTHTQLGLVQKRGEGYSMSFSPDNQLLAIAAGKRTIVIKDLSLIKEEDIHIDHVALDAWKRGQLENADALLTAAISTSKDSAHHMLASRALVRARLGQHDAALVDAEESIKVQLSIVGYIAKYVALVGMDEIDRGHRMCDLAFLHFHSHHVALLLLVKAVILFTTGKCNDAISRIGDFITAAFLDTTFYLVQAYMHFLLGNLHMEEGDYERAIQSFEDARARLGGRIDQPPLIVSLILGWKFDDLATTIQQRSCEALLLAGRTKDAGESVLRMVHHYERIETWVSDFMQRCLSTPENGGSMSVEATRDKNASIPREISDTAPSTPLLREWAKLKLTAESWKDALAAAMSFTFPRLTIYRVICEHLETTGRIVDAVACFHQMCGELSHEVGDKEVNWSYDFESRCCEELEDRGDIAMNTKEYDNAISQYTAALSLGRVTPQDVLVKRSKAHESKGEWDNALNDAIEVIMLDPSSPWGYERKHAALHGKGDYDDAIVAFQTMLAKMVQSSDPEVRERSFHYITPQRTEGAIRTVIGDTLHDSPLVLINTASGRLCDRSEQAGAFVSMPIFRKLISSVTTDIDHTAIQEEVGEFYRYAMFSHRWEENEPLYQDVIQTTVYDPKASTHKLRMFCRIVQQAGLNWAWSDTCCIDKRDPAIVQEAIISMFKWYENSALTIIFLLGVRQLAQFGALAGSIWNMRAWTLQEYRASKVVRFYTQDWTPYLGLDIDNHKDSLQITSEMEEATGISAETLMSLSPGLDHVREKLRLASARQATRVEDTAYSLLGIFSTSMPILYGDGDKALGQLLAQLLTSSGDMSILAWSGSPGSFNSCLPASITVFSKLPTSHIPQAIPDDKMPTLVAGLRSLNLTTVTRLYDKLNDLPVPSFSGRRMRLPCLTFKLRQVLGTWNGSNRVFRAQTKVFGTVEITTEEDLSRLDLYLIHPWIDFLLDRHPVGNPMATITEENVADNASLLGELPPFPGPSGITSETRQTRTAQLSALLRRPFGGRSALDAMSLRSSSTISRLEKQTHVRQFITRLRQPFGALLLTPTRRNVKEYRRVAPECLIRVQVQEITPEILGKLIDAARTVDVL